MKRSLIQRLAKPEYFYRPEQILRRAFRLLHPRRPASAETILPWGLKIRFHPDETVGDSLWKMGIFELAVSEAIGRLIAPGEHVVDAGANIGQMTSLMAVRVGPAGTVTCFEPHPEVFSELQANVAHWRDGAGTGKISERRLALSDQAGTAVLTTPPDFEENRGTAWIPETGTEAASGGKSFSIETVRLDDLPDLPERIGLLKMDVQGHEINVLRGAAGRIERHAIRDILFEEEGDYAAPTIAYLRARGYTIFRLGRTFSGVFLHPADEHALPPSNETRNFLATTDPERALSRFREKGWGVLAARR